MPSNAYWASSPGCVVPVVSSLFIIVLVLFEVGSWTTGHGIVSPVIITHILQALKCVACIFSRLLFIFLLLAGGFRWYDQGSWLPICPLWELYFRCSCCALWSQIMNAVVDSVYLISIFNGLIMIAYSLLFFSNHFPNKVPSTHKTSVIDSCSRMPKIVICGFEMSALRFQAIWLFLAQVMKLWVLDSCAGSQ